LKFVKSGNIPLSGTLIIFNEEAALINQNKIDEWIHEVEERPASAGLIIQYIANRLSELASREEELAAQNIELLSGRKVEDYENRIANLEYQLELLKRQLGGEIILPTEMPTKQPLVEMIEVLVYNPLGQVLRVEFNPKGLTSGQTITQLTSDASLEDMQPSVLAIPSQEELLFLFDSGRTVTLPVSHLPVYRTDNLPWQQAFIQEPRVKEELAAIIPIARMSLYEACVQASRRGFVKKVKTSILSSHITEKYIGTGVKLPADKTCGLTFTSKGDLFVMVSQEGYIFSMRADHLPVAIEEVVHLGITDHIVTAFATGQKPSILFITQNGKAVHRDTSWFEPASSFKTKGQPLLSKERRESGTRVVGAAAVDDADWGIFLYTDGTLIAHKLRDLLAAGSALIGSQVATIISFSSFHMPEVKG
jgi:DNA gyrase/topoisomerase IV subunit A